MKVGQISMAKRGVIVDALLDEPLVLDKVRGKVRDNQRRIWLDKSGGVVGDVLGQAWASRRSGNGNGHGREDVDVV